MGCDIHAYIDFDDFKNNEGEWWVSSFADNVNFHRNYTLFSLMAGVRYDPQTDVDYEPIFQPRGIFERLSWRTKDAYILRVDNEANAKGWEGYRTTANALEWVRHGYSVELGEKVISGPDWHSASWLHVSELERIKEVFEQIGFYERSWTQFDPPSEQPIPDNATSKQIVNTLGRMEWYVTVGEKKTYPISASFNAIVAAMKALNGDNPERSRLVFWFDN